MKLNLERLEELKLELQRGPVREHREHYEPMGLEVIMEAVRCYLYNGNINNEIITKLLTDYGVLVNETDDETPIVKPHRFTNNG